MDLFSCSPKGVKIELRTNLGSLSCKPFVSSCIMSSVRLATAFAPFQISDDDRHNHRPQRRRQQRGGVPEAMPLSAGEDGAHAHSPRRTRGDMDNSSRWKKKGNRRTFFCSDEVSQNPDSTFKAQLCVNICYSQACTMLEMNGKKRLNPFVRPRELAVRLLTVRPLWANEFAQSGMCSQDQKLRKALHSESLKGVPWNEC